MGTRWTFSIFDSFIALPPLFGLRCRFMSKPIPDPSDKEFTADDRPGAEGAVTIGEADSGGKFPSWKTIRQIVPNTAQTADNQLKKRSAIVENAVDFNNGGPGGQTAAVVGGT